MEDFAQQSLLGSLLELGCFQAGALVFSMFCAGLLVINRILGCFYLRAANAFRDSVLLMAMPVAAVLISIIRITYGAATFLQGGVDGDSVLRHSFMQAWVVSYIALACFIIGVVSIMLPNKGHAKNS